MPLYKNRTVSITRQTFEQAFVFYYDSLYGFAFGILRDELVAEEVVSDVFYKAWKKRDLVVAEASFAGYLYRSVHNTCLDHLRQKRVKQAYIATVISQLNERSDTDQSAGLIEQKEFEETIRQALLKLPEQCRTVFQLSRVDEMSNRVIAERLGISIKTVEAHMGKALKRLRLLLAEFLTLLIVFLWHQN